MNDAIIFVVVLAALLAAWSLRWKALALVFRMHAPSAVPASDYVSRTPEMIAEHRKQRAEFRQEILERELDCAFLRLLRHCAWCNDAMTTGRYSCSADAVNAFPETWVECAEGRRLLALYHKTLATTWEEPTE